MKDQVKKKRKDLRKRHRRNNVPGVKIPPRQGEEPLADMFFGGTPFESGCDIFSPPPPEEKA